MPKLKPAKQGEKASDYTLVLVESPAKAKTIEKFLGPGYKVAASYGHVRDLPSRKSKSPSKVTKTTKRATTPKDAQARWVEKLGIDPFNGWKARYEIPLEKRKVVVQLKSLSAGASAIYLATDPDREGEAIAWHLQAILGGDEARYRRIAFNAITPSAVLKAVENPGSLNLDFVHAQQTRRFLDRLVGFMVSPILWSKLFRGLSAGRVQTPAVALIVERESEIQSFVPKAYQELVAHLVEGPQTKNATPLKLTKVEGKSFKGENFEENQRLVQALEAAKDWCVAALQPRLTRLAPPPPFTTSTLQQCASQRLRWSVKRVMVVAQKLYEHGLITYMRTDSVRVAPEALQEVRDWIATHYAPSYGLPKPRFFKGGQRAQEAHEAIRPTQVSRLPQEVESRWGADETKLYHLIRGRFLASQMAEAQILQACFKVQVCEGRCSFDYVGKKVQFEGWMEAFDSPQARMEKIVPDWQVGQVLQLRQLECLDKTTHPPLRYTESKLVKELEKQGIGRPSTYALILETIQSRGYVQLRGGHFHALRLGYLVVKRLVDGFSDIFSTTFTSHMEDTLDKVAHAKADWQLTLDQFFSHLSQQVQRAQAPEVEGGMPQLKGVPCPELTCSKCQAPKVLKCGPFGLNLQCSQAGVSCEKQTEALLSPEQWPEEAKEGARDLPLLNFEAPPPCPVCGIGMELMARAGADSALWVCHQAPDCGGHALLPLPKPLWKGEEGLDVLCMACGAGHYIKKLGRFGPYAVCEACGDKKKWKGGQVVLKPTLVVEFPELRSARFPDAWFVLREGEAGLFLASNRFPKVRESRAPKVSELYSALERLPEPWKKYAQAPLQDESGHPTYLRFDRKLKKIYVGSKLDDNTKRWTAFRYDYPEEDGAV